MTDEADKPKVEILLIRQGFFQSVGSDAVTLGMLIVLPWFNYQYCGGSGWINFAIAAAWFIAIISRASGQRAKFIKTPEQARAWLDENYPAEVQASKARSAGA